MRRADTTHWLEDVASFAGVELEVSPAPTFTEVKAGWDHLARAFSLREEDFAKRVAGHFRLSIAQLDRIQGGAVALLPQKVARAYGVIPVRLEGDVLVVASADPASQAARDSIVSSTGRQVRFEVAPPRQLEQAIQRTYAGRRYSEASIRDLVTEASSEDFSVIQNAGLEFTDRMELDSPAVVELTRRILVHAISRGATDVHVEPEGNTVGRIRLRVDGVVQPLLNLPRRALDRIVLRLKTMGELDLTDRLGAQDGWTDVEVGGRRYELRILTLPVPEGQKVLVRMGNRTQSFAMRKLNLPDREALRVHDLLGRPDGLILFAGPTRSGKTTLLYSALTALASGQRNIATLENPIEANLEGVNQTAFDPSRWPGYAVALQNLLQHDPDIIAAGEIRDLATARTVVRASVTGHLVLATLHTQDAVGAVGRLADMGMDRGRVAESLRGVVAQRLVRQLCPSCARPAADPSELPSLERELAEAYGVLPRHFAPGCEACGNTGYRGQLPVMEVLEVTPAVAALMTQGASLAEIEEAAREEGMRSLLEVALSRVARGETSLQEVRRVLGLPAARAGAKPRARHVLVVDDDPQDRLVIRTVLERNGYEVTEVKDGEGALQVLDAGAGLSVVLLDLSMPGLDGLAVLRRTRESPAAQGLPVVVLTSSEDPEDELALLEAGADDYLRKPVDPRRLAARLRAVSRRSAPFPLAAETN